MRRIVIGIALLAIVAAPAFAQGRKPEVKEPTAEELQKKRDADAADRQYRATLRATDPGNAPVAIDPWRNMRGPNEPKR